MTETPIIDGGPAFSHGNPEQGGHPGMTLRDWFAATLVGLDISQSLAADLVGRPMPTHSGGAGGWRAAAEWWAEAEARFRYLRADAMLAERERRS